MVGLLFVFLGIDDICCISYFCWCVLFFTAEFVGCILRKTNIYNPTYYIDHRGFLCDSLYELFLCLSRVRFVVRVLTEPRITEGQPM